MKALLVVVLLLTFGAGVWGVTPEEIDAAFTPEFVERLEKAAEQGLAEAQWYLGDAYANGNGVPQNFKEAVKWYKKTAEQGDADAQHNLGGAYFFGNGVIKNKIQGYAWWNIAAANGYEDAKEWKAEVAEEMTKEEIDKAQDLSREMFKTNPKLMGD